MTDTVVVNVSGRRFEIERNVLSKFPDSTVGRLAGSDQKEFSFQRPICVFECVLSYHQTGHLHIPVSVCPGSVQDELQFWGFSTEDLETCCRQTLKIFYRNQAAIRLLEKEDNFTDSTDAKYSLPLHCFNRERIAMWEMFEKPFLSLIGKFFLVPVYFSISSLLIIVSAALVILGILPEYREDMTMADWKNYFGEDDYYEYEDYLHYDYAHEDDFENSNTNISDYDEGNFTLPKDTYKKNSNLELANNVCAVFFFFELLLKLLCCPGIIRFFKSFLNIVDVLAVGASVSEFVTESVCPKEKYTDSFLDALDGLLVLRSIRLFRLARNVAGGRALFYALKMSIKEVGFMVLLLAINCIVFGTIVYYCDPKKMKTISDALWWAVITMTTVGYGDIVPSSPLSKVIGAVCACTGILIMALTMPLFVSNFTMLYSHTSELNIHSIHDVFITNLKKERTVVFSQFEH